MNEAALYRLAARVLFAPFGGLESIRRQAIDALEIRPGARVLEPGCGPGDVTAQLLARGASVEAVDASSGMLRIAAQRAPGATFVQSDIRAYSPAARFDAMLLLFVLHELPIQDTLAFLRSLRDDMPDGARLIIADHAAPAGLRGRLWRGVLGAIETPSIGEWLAVNPRSLIEAAGCVVDRDIELAGGRVRLVAGVARRAA